MGRKSGTKNSLNFTIVSIQAIPHLNIGSCRVTRVVVEDLKWNRILCSAVTLDRLNE